MTYPPPIYPEVFRLASDFPGNRNVGEEPETHRTTGSQEMQAVLHALPSGNKADSSTTSHISTTVLNSQPLVTAGINAIAGNDPDQQGNSCVYAETVVPSRSCDPDPSMRAACPAPQNEDEMLITDSHLSISEKYVAEAGTGFIGDGSELQNQDALPITNLWPQLTSTATDPLDTNIFPAHLASPSSAMETSSLITSDVANVTTFQSDDAVTAPCTFEHSPILQPIEDVPLPTLFSRDSLSIASVPSSLLCWPAPTEQPDSPRASAESVMTQDELLPASMSTVTLDAPQLPLARLEEIGSSTDYLQTTLAFDAAEEYRTLIPDITLGHASASSATNLGLPASDSLITTMSSSTIHGPVDLTSDGSIFHPITNAVTPSTGELELGDSISDSTTPQGYELSVKSASQSSSDVRSPALPPSSPPTSPVSDLRLSQVLDVNSEPGIPGKADRSDENTMREVYTTTSTDLSDCLFNPDSAYDTILDLGLSMTSSPIPSSSPDRFFSSSPPDRGNTPASSPPYLNACENDGKEEEMQEDLLTVELQEDPPSILGKRPRSESSSHDVRQFDDVKIDDAKGEAKDLIPDILPNSPPNPKRLTLASQKKQQKKLATPFRSPIIKNDSPLLRKVAAYATAKSNSSSLNDDNVTKTTASPFQPTKPNAPVATPKDYTQSAARQFKSPMAFPLSVASNSTAAVSRSNRTSYTAKVSTGTGTPTIQALQAKVQKLKQAIKIKDDGVGKAELQLDELVKKWRTAGREVAWEVWNTVKDLDPGEVMNIGKTRGGWDEDEVPYHGTSGKKRGMDAAWGYDDDREVKRVKVGGFDSNWGWTDDGKGMQPDGRVCDMNNAETDDFEEGAGGKHTLGTMLRYMGIAPETLGWDEEEGDFVDDV